MVYPLIPPALFFWSMANLMPLAVDWPPTVQTGRSDPILMVPFDPVPPVVPPQAKATNAATMRTPSPLARTIWFLHVFVGRPEEVPLGQRLPSLAALFPTCVGARVRRRRMRPHGVAEPLLRGELSTCICLEVKRCFGSPFGGSALHGSAVVSIGECCAVIFGPDEAPGKSWIRRACPGRALCHRRP